eukprot:892592-Rhodomonas_salina.2
MVVPSTEESHTEESDTAEEVIPEELEHLVELAEPGIGVEDHLKKMPSRMSSWGSARDAGKSTDVEAMIAQVQLLASALSC